MKVTNLTNLVVLLAAATALSQGAACSADIAGNPGPGGSGTGNRGGTSMTGTGGNGGAAGVGAGGAGVIEPGRVTAHRLNIREYNNTIRDLIGMDLKPANEFQFPEDEWGDGFNNDADVLTVSPLSVEKYLSAAQSVVLKGTAVANAAARAKIFVCDFAGTNETACVSQILTQFARRAFRRTVKPEELAPYTGLLALAKQKGETVEGALQTALSAILTAPDFLYRLELDPTPGVVRPLDNFELASRLSYFIWASMPDDELLGSAEMARLIQPAELTKQVKRMFADPKASAFRDIMIEQWIHTIGLQFAAPDATLFPRWQEPLRAAMEQEIRQFFLPILSGTVPARELLNAKYTYVNRALGQFYGLPGAATLPADTFTKVTLTDDRRGGILRQAGMLVQTSRPDRTSPTKRGKWILERLLCDPPPPPPANVPELDPNVPFNGTQRQRLEMVHQKAGSTCKTCHVVLDPMGFALEHYDAIGLWRDQDNNFPIDTTGKMPVTDVPFDGAAQVAEAIAADARFPACVAKQFLTYAVGRHMTPADQPLIDSLGKTFAAGNYNVAQLVELVASSAAMTQRRAE